MNEQIPLNIKPIWTPIGQYRTIPLPILPMPPFMKRIPYPKVKVNKPDNSNSKA